MLDSVPLPDSPSIDIPESSELARQIVSSWVSDFNQCLNEENTDIRPLFLEKSCWRDLLCMTWDFRTIQGPEAITKFVASCSDGSRINSIGVYDSPSYKIPRFAHCGKVRVVQAFLSIDTAYGRGEGLVRLVPDPKEKDTWRAFTLLTKLEELKGYEENTHNRRPTGHNGTADSTHLNWKDQLNAQHNFRNGDGPVVVILGAGQGGLAMAARLKQLNLETLIIDRTPRIGDNWRNRYHQLVLHDTVWFDHMPYLPFPPSWPVFTPKDKLADWFEYYAGILELNVWTNSTLQESKWDDHTRQWTIKVERNRDGTLEDHTLNPRHIILATGHAGEPYVPPGINFDSFQGNRIIHSSQFTEPQRDANGKKAVMVGCCNSAHDIARDYHEHGYDVTMIQRSSTLVLTCGSLVDVTMKGLYAEDGSFQPPVEAADIINMSVPNPVAKTLQTAATKEILKRDNDLITGLLAAGFALDSGIHGSGLWIKYLSRGGGYYIDVGASKLVVDGKIKIKQGSGVKAVKAHGVLLEDGSELEADEVIFATGYQNMKESARTIFGNEVADRVRG
ncbi:MAG: hypothetical protein Q9195_004721 [Heterodermia aff. obscurata]